MQLQKEQSRSHLITLKQFQARLEVRLHQMEENENLCVLHYSCLAHNNRQEHHSSIKESSKEVGILIICSGIPIPPLSFSPPIMSFPPVIHSLRIMPMLKVDCIYAYVKSRLHKCLFSCILVNQEAEQKIRHHTCVFKRATLCTLRRPTMSL